MAGIFGCFNANDPAKNKLHCSSMERSSIAGFSHTSECKSLANDALCFGYTTRHTSPDCAIYSTEDSDETLLICGELFLPSGEELSYKNFASEFLPRYRKAGKVFFHDCDGSYTLAIYVPRSKQLQIVSDPFGNFALHYAISQDGFLFSSQQLGIAEALGSREFSEESLLEYLALGQQLEGRTFYKNITRLPPGSILTIDRSGSAELTTYYSPDYKDSGDITSELRRVEESLLHSLDIRTQRPGIVFGLSGGLDSRISLAGLKKLGKTNSVTALTHGLRSSYDMRIAQKLAAKYSMNHHQIFFDDEFIKEFPGHWKEITRLSEGGLGIESTYILASWQRQSKKFGISIDSHGGPLYRRQILKARENTLQQAKDFPGALFHYVSSALLKSGLLKNDIAEQAKATGKASIEDYFSSFPAAMNAGDKIDRFYLEQMSANKYALSANVQINFIGLSHPLLAPNAMSAARRISESERKRNVIYRYLLNRFAPELKYVTVDNSGFPVPYLGYRALRYGPPVFEKFLLKLPRSFHKYSLRRPTITHRLVARKNLPALKKLLLEGDPRTDAIFDRSKIESALLDFESGRKDNYAALIQAANVRLLVELFA